MKEDGYKNSKGWFNWIDKMLVSNIYDYTRTHKNFQKRGTWSYWRKINKLLKNRYKRIAKAMGFSNWNSLPKNPNKSYQGFFAKRGTGNNSKAYFNPFTDDLTHENTNEVDDDDNEYYRPNVVMYRPFDYDDKPIYSDAKNKELEVIVDASDMIDSTLSKSHCEEFAKHYGKDLVGSSNFSVTSDENIAYGCNIQSSKLIPDKNNPVRYIKWNNKLNQQGSRFTAVLPGKNPGKYFSELSTNDTSTWYSVQTNTSCSAGWDIIDSYSGSARFASFNIGKHCVKNIKRKYESEQMQIINAFEMNQGWLFQLSNKKWVRAIDLYLPNQADISNQINVYRNNVDEQTTQAELTLLNNFMDKYWLSQNDIAESLLNQRIMDLNASAKEEIIKMKQADIEAQIKAETDKQKARLEAIKMKQAAMKKAYDKAIKEANDKNVLYQFSKTMKKLGIDAAFGALGKAIRSVEFIDSALTGLENISQFIKAETGCNSCEVAMVVFEPTFKVLYKVLVTGGPWMGGFSALMQGILMGLVAQQIMILIANSGIMSSIAALLPGKEGSSGSGCSAGVDTLGCILEVGITEGIFCFLVKLGLVMPLKKGATRSLTKLKNKISGTQNPKTVPKDKLKSKKPKKAGSLKSEIGHTFIKCIIIELIRAIVMASTGCNKRCKCKFSFMKLAGAIESAC